MEHKMDPSKGVIVVTGASRGLGLGLACLIAAQGVPVVITGRHRAAIDRVGARLQDAARVQAVQADAADEAAMGRVMEAAASIGPVHGLVNNAGVLEPIGSVLDIEPAAFESTMRTNVSGVLVGIRAALRARTSGAPMRIVNISSGAATHAYAGWAAYCASKAAVNLLTQVCAIECAASPATSVVAVAPGVIETAMQRTIRAASWERFPDRDKFVHLKDSGALLHPVEAAVALDWLVRAAPFELSGRFLDARGKEVLGLVQEHRTSIGDAMGKATTWFDELESDVA